MSEEPIYSETAPSLGELEAAPRPVVLEFGNDWCGFCQAARPLVDEAMGETSGVDHVRVADGRGKRLGRHFKVKLWPTLIVLDGGVERARVVRPPDVDSVREALSAVAAD